MTTDDQTRVEAAAAYDVFHMFTDGVFGEDGGCIISPKEMFIHGYLSARDEANQRPSAGPNMNAGLINAVYPSDTAGAARLESGTGANGQAPLVNPDPELRPSDSNSVHSCSEACQRLPCVQRREIERQREALRYLVDEPKLCCSHGCTSGAQEG